MLGGKTPVEGMMSEHGGRSSSSSNKYNSAGDKIDEENTTNHFFAIFSQYDISFLVVISLCNFVQGFRRLLELGLYFVFKDKLGL